MFLCFQQESVFQQQSPTKRRESTPLLDKIKTDVTLVKQKLGNEKKGDKPKEVKEELLIMKYITSQVPGLLSNINCQYSILRL